MTNKDILEKEARDKISRFCKANNIVEPNIIVNNKLKIYGVYRSRTNEIEFNKSKCLPPVKTPGWSWTYPGYTADLTVAGVLYHEFGHHVYCTKKLFNKINFDPNFSGFTSYNPNDSEIFAEIFKLYMSNPDLVKNMSKNIYDMLENTCNLKHVDEIKPWREVLKNAHEKIIKSCEKKIKKNNKSL